MSVVLVNVAENGRMVLPAEVRRALGVNGPSQVRVEVAEDGVRITTPRQALMRARARIQAIVPADQSLSAELLADRQAEAEQDASEMNNTKRSDANGQPSDGTKGQSE